MVVVSGTSCLKDLWCSGMTRGRPVIAKKFFTLLLHFIFGLMKPKGRQLYSLETEHKSI
jgi:hypothetical protein